ncbi:hypothetical protein D3C83_19620 [compost metagenome]
MQLARLPKKFRGGLVAAILDGFEDMLPSLQGPGFEFVKTSGTRRKTGWADELHPHLNGFRKRARCFRKTLLKRCSSSASRLSPRY